MQWCIVQGDSMYPMIKDKDLILMENKDKRRLRKGRVVIFKDEKGKLIVHRIIKKKDGTIYLRGDGFDYPVDMIKEEDVLGLAVGIFRNGRYFPIKRSKELFFWFFSYPRRFFVNIRRRFLNGIKTRYHL